MTARTGLGQTNRPRSALRRQIDERELRLTHDERRRLAVRGKKHGRKLLGKCASIVTPDRSARIQYRTPTQLGPLERFRCTLETEEVYWRLYDNPAHCRQCLEEFRECYNAKRPH